MPSKEIKELRASGKLEEALVMAQNELEASSDNIWAKRNLAWVYYFMLKELKGDQDNFLKIIGKVIALKLPENENMFYEQFCWIVGMHNFQVSKSGKDKQLKLSYIQVILEQVSKLKFSSSEGYSFLLKSFHNEFKGIGSKGAFHQDFFLDYSKSYTEFISWCGFNNFIEEDFKLNEINGRKIISFVEQIIIAYSKVLLKGESEGLKSMDTEKIDHFLIFLNKVINDHPENQYTLYYKSKLLLALNRFNDAKDSLIPFVKKQKNVFWVWQLLSEVFPDDTDLQIACLCKGLSLNTKESFLVKVHQKLATILIEEKLFKEASIEILNVCLIRKKNNWKISNQLSNILNKPWYNNEVSKSDNLNFYLEQSSLAEELLYNNHEEIIIAIEFVNTNKKMVNFVKDKKYNGFFSYSHLKISPEVGDIYKTRLNKIGKEGFYKVLTIKSSPNSGSEAVKKVSGNLSVIENKDFGFIQDIFFSPDFIKEKNLINGSEVSGKAILTFNKKKNDWGWKIFRLNKEQILNVNYNHNL
jgi:hypothetical protein